MDVFSRQCEPLANPNMSGQIFMYEFMTRNMYKTLFLLESLHPRLTSLSRCHEA